MRHLLLLMLCSAASCRQASNLDPQPSDCIKAEFAVEAATIWLSRQRFRDQFIPASARAEDAKDHWNIWIRNVENHMAPAEGLIKVSKAECRTQWIPLK
jgi:hypothetical protein